MKKMLIISAYGASSMMFGQVGINTETPHPSSDLELGSNNKALYLNRVENPETNISSPQNGMILYDTTKKCVRAYQNNAWSNCFGVPVENVGTVVSLECNSATHSGIIYNGTAYTSGIETSVPYSGGNGGSYSAMSINSTGVTGLVATLQAGNLNNGSGNLIFQITGTPSGTGSALFTVNIAGKTCNFTRNVEPQTPTVGTVTSLNCNAQLNPTTLFVDQNYSGVLKIQYTGGNGGSYNADTFTLKGLTFTRNAGNFVIGNGEIVYNVSGIPDSTGSIIINEIIIGGQSCTSLNVGIITGLTLYCDTGSYQPVLNPDNLIAGQTYTGTYTVKYFTNSGGFYDGTAYPAESFTVNGLTFSRSAGTFTGGSVTDIIYNVAGTPTTSGNTNITVNLADKTCTKSVNVAAISANCINNDYIIHNGQKSVRICGQIWMQHNLGANTNLDPNANPQSQALIGNYYQYGRNAVIATGYTSPGPITGFNTSWPVPANPTQRWNTGTETSPVKNTTYDPCPSGFRLPTLTEFQKLAANTTLEVYGNNWSSNDNNYDNAIIFKSGNVQVTFPAGGFRTVNGPGNLQGRGQGGTYYTSTIGNVNPYNTRPAFLGQSGLGGGMQAGNRAFNVKCIAQ
ncbi:FISUMP domain-containing protein [Chryseobacterium echinoideorum]|uniref:FISUMP domain-containing protein n=1 Tax=Chryseobacterium echinoideorum TaxID=1549648 RepID=UPI0011858ED7|nr:FISUMP domain-containing protein [Chryseobacterium echinoideorum]